MSADSKGKKTEEGLTRRSFLGKASLGIVGAIATGAVVKKLATSEKRKPNFGDIPPEGSIFEPRADIKEAWLKKSLSEREGLLRRGN